jgi:hypothetical protein
MKNFLFILCGALLLASCSTKKSETTSTADSLSIQTDLADTPAPNALAFSPVGGFSYKGGEQADTVDFLLINNQVDLESYFTVDKSRSADMTPPDFVINHVIAVVCLPSLHQPTIGLEKVEVGDGAINVYVTIQRGKEHTITAKAAQLFAIERRDGFTTLQFFVNGKKSKALMLI